MWDITLFWDEAHVVNVGQRSTYMHEITKGSSGGGPSTPKPSVGDVD